MYIHLLFRTRACILFGEPGLGSRDDRGDVEKKVLSDLVVLFEFPVKLHEEETLKRMRVIIGVSRGLPKDIPLFGPLLRRSFCSRGAPHGFDPLS
jgi:hypothetical protein